MNFRQLAHNTRFGTCALIGAAGLMLAGCSSESANAGAPAPQSTATKAPAPSTAKVAGLSAEKSVFTIDQNSRDPFFPKAKKAVAVTDTTQPQVAVDVTALLQAGFQGVIGNDKAKIALINNIMLEPGRQTLIPISAAGHPQSVSVRCLEVLKDAVVLEVQGHTQPIRLIRTAYN